MDVASAQQAAERVRASEARKAAILEASLDPVITIDPEGTVVDYNAAAEVAFGYGQEAVVGRPLVELVVPPRMRAQALASLKRFRETGESALPRKRIEAFAQRSDGSEFAVEIAVSPIQVEGRSLLAIYVSDVTERRQAEQEIASYQERLRSLAADLLVAEERERRRLAVDLHDGLSQTIALVQMKLAALRRSTDEAVGRSLAEIERLIDQANRSARSITFELSPPVLHDLGLEPAVQWLVENLQARYGVEIVLEDDGRPKPADEKTRVILFRSIRELLINAAKHAGAQRIHVRLESSEGSVDVEVEDDGVGMVPDLSGVRGTGLFSIRERLSRLGGSMRIDSAPGQGTRVRLRAAASRERP